MPEPQGETICSETCEGRGTPEIVHELQMRGAPVRRCYNRALAIDPTARGKMRVMVVIGSDGRTCDSRVLDSDLPSTMSDCVLDAYRGRRYPEPVNGCVKVTVPFGFEPKDGSAGAPP